MGDRIWLIGGTSESRELATAIALAQFPCTVSVTTPAAVGLYTRSPMLRVWVGRLEAESIAQFLQQEQIAAVLDASHPYAVAISQMAIAAAQRFQIPYLRYERPEGERARGREGVRGGQEIYVDSFDALVAGDYLEGQRVLLTVGYRYLHLFSSWQERSTLFARILPSVSALEAAMAAGFTSDRLIALRPPISFDLEKALWQHWKISLVATKASGSTGGEDVKRAVAAELGIGLIAIARPEVVYPQQTSELSTALEFCVKAIAKENKNLHPHHG
ncbi:MAG: cobalt-precorrin-6A reductase [Cyanosarcina radialis HA8281-LM2]|jgi:precorrin-6A/cobalt-precorrin-6A reductase|nr:cobalt-precorrin-6A reductase [Cyanosarcina radialis HA8281-LM2]